MTCIGSFTSMEADCGGFGLDPSKHVFWGLEVLAATQHAKPHTPKLGFLRVCARFGESFCVSSCLTELLRSCYNILWYIALSPNSPSTVHNACKPHSCGSSAPPQYAQAPSPDLNSRLGTGRKLVDPLFKYCTLSPSSLHPPCRFPGMVLSAAITVVSSREFPMTVRKSTLSNHPRRLVPLAASLPCPWPMPPLTCHFPEAV